MKIAITGHRPNKLGNDYDLVSPLIIKIKNELEAIIQDHLDHTLDNSELTLISGMALGIDTLWAKLAHTWELPLIAAIPCKNQWSQWTPKSIALYNGILQHPLTTIVNVSHKNYYPACMQERNIWMVDNCDILIGVHDGSSGGTKNCIDYAISKGFTKENGKLIIINPKEL